MEAKKINEILLEIKGRAKTYWTKHSGKSRRHCSLSEPYFCEQFNTLYTHKFDLKLSNEKDNYENSSIKDENTASTSYNVLVSLKNGSFIDTQRREVCF